MWWSTSILAFVCVKDLFHAGSLSMLHCMCFWHIYLIFIFMFLCFFLCLLSDVFWDALISGQHKLEIYLGTWHFYAFSCFIIHTHTHKHTLRDICIHIHLYMHKYTPVHVYNERAMLLNFMREYKLLQLATVCYHGRVVHHLPCCVIIYSNGYVHTCFLFFFIFGGKSSIFFD